MDQIWESKDKTVKKVVLEKGIFSEKPTECATCKVIIQNIYVTGASLADLTEKYQSEILDASLEKVIVIGEANSELDRKVERAIQMMMINEKSQVTISMFHISEFAKESTIIKFDITLINCESYEQIWKWTPEEKYAFAKKCKEQGVHLFKESKHIDAFNKFSKGCKILITLEPISDLKLDEILEKDINNLRIMLYNNMAGCHLIVQNFEHTIALCNKVIEKDTSNVKALYRRGVAYGNLKNIEKAVADLKNVVTLEPYNTPAREQYQIYFKKLQEANKKFEDIVKKMFKS